MRLHGGDGGVQPGQGGVGVLDDLRLADAVGFDPGEVGGQAFDLGGGLFGLALQPIVLDREAVHDGAGGLRLFAPGPDGGFGRERGGRRRRRNTRRVLNGARRLAGLGLRAFHGGGGLGPADIEHRALQASDLGRQSLELFRLARLALQARQGGLKFGGDIAQARHIGLGGAQAKLGLVPASVQAGDTGRLFQDQATVLRLGGDQLADLALAHQGRRIGPGGGVGE